MKTATYLLAFLISCPFFLFAQMEVEWERHFGGSSWDEANAIQQTDDQGYIVVGRSNSEDVGGNNGSADYWVLKLTPTGDSTWAHHFGGSGWDEATAVQQTDDRGYIVAGWSDSGDVGGNNGGSDFWILKLTPAGDSSWVRNFGSSGADVAYSVQQTDDGGYVVAGYSTSSDQDVGGNNGGRDYWVLKLDSNGNISWEQNLGGSNGDEAKSIQQTNDGGYIVAGSSLSNDGDVEGNSGSSDYWVVKLNPNGSIAWNRSFNGSGPSQIDWATAVLPTDDGGYVVTGASDMGDTGQAYDFWVIKLDPNGITAWNQHYGIGSSDQATAIQQTDDGGYILTGRSDIVDMGQDFDYWIVKIDSNGNLVSEQHFGGSGRDEPTAIQQTDDGGYIVAGHSDSADRDVGGNNGGRDYWIVKLQPCPSYTTTVDTIVCPGQPLPTTANLVTYYGCDSIINYNIIELPLPDAGEDAIVCESVAQLSAIALGDAITGLWTSSTSGIAFENPTFPNTSIGNFPFGMHQLTWTVSHSLCPNYAQDSVSVNYLDLPEAYAGENKTVCDSQVQLAASSITPPITGNWTSDPSRPSFSSLSLPNTTVSNLAPGDNLLFWTVSHPSCLNYSQNTVFVTYLDLMEANAGIGFTVCTPEAQLDAVVPPFPVTGKWTGSPEVSFLDAADPFTEVSGLVPGQNDLIWALSHSECPNYSSAEVAVFYEDGVIQADDDVYSYSSDMLQESVLDNDLFPNLGDVEVTIVEDLGGADDAGQLTLDTFGNFDFSLLEPTVVLSRRFRYRIAHKSCPELFDEAIARINLNGNAGTGTEESFSLVFTPNGDGVNDFFIIPELEERPQDFPSNSLAVINRWGDIVYQAQPYNNDWDGTHWKTGKKLPPGTYFYIARLSVVDGIIRKERVTLIR